MIQPSSRMKVADNTGARVIECIRILGRSQAPAAGVGDVIVGSIKQAIRLLYRSHLPFSQALETIEKELSDSESVVAMLRFCRDSQRGLIHPPRRRV